MKPKPKTKLLALVVPAPLHEGLSSMAKAVGQPVEDLAERMLARIEAEWRKQAGGDA
ncbi:MAG TPA: hypothetical protein VMF90_06060 [Rhizobiaceae bacterium]|nr:hypothetical protein [Rhizobiaceae bacterium]